MVLGTANLASRRPCCAFSYSFAR